MDYEDLSGDSSSEGGEQLEVVEILDNAIHIPQGIAESSEIFKQIFSKDIFNSLSTTDRQHLLQFLPQFPANDEKEKEITLDRLFNQDNFKFGSPLQEFHTKLQTGYYRPDIAPIHVMMKKAGRQQYKDYMKRVCYSMLKSIIVSRRKMLEEAMGSSSGSVKQTKQYQSPTGDFLSHRVKKRYFQELAAFRSEVGEYSQSSEDENYTDRAPKTISKKQRQKLQMIENGFSTFDMTMITSTLATKPKGFDLENQITSTSNPYDITEETYRKMLTSHKRKRATQDKTVKLTPSAALLKELHGKIPSAKRRPSVKCGGTSSPVLPSEKIKKKSSSACTTPVPRFKSEPILNDSPIEQNFSKKMKYDFESEIVKKSGDSTDEEIQGTLPLEPNELDKNIDVESASPTNIPQNQQLMENQAQQHLAIPTEPVASFSMHDEKKIVPPKHARSTDLMQDTHVCFFSLLRDIICASAHHRMRLDRIENRLKLWESNPISPLNEWFSIVDESWYNLLDSALCFLSGEFPDELEPEDFVPYIEFKSSLKCYQWIGAGRDSDAHLLALCSHWLDHREEMSPSLSSITQPSVLPASVPELDCEMADADEVDDAEPQPIVSVVVVGEEPPPRWSTNWTVRPSTEDEKLKFQAQERERFQNPTKAFTYVMHGYESVVGPVKGINTNQSSTSVLKPRGHNILALGRPSYVTALSLVRDAAARLPNGEGTRADMCILLKDSQYLDLTGAGESALQNVVSSALDRLHYEVDSSVRFDTKRKIWIYLHRNRTEKEMENMYHIYQGMSKGAKKPPRKKPVKKTDPNATPKEPRKPKNSAKLVAMMKETEDAVSGLKDANCINKESQIIDKPTLMTIPQQAQTQIATPELVETIKQDKRSVPQEIVTSSGKKFLIQTTFAGRNPMKFISTPSTSKTTLVTKTVDATTQGKPTIVTSSDGTLFKTTSVASTAPIQTATPGQSFLMNNLAGTQFLTASGKKVQLIGSHQSIGSMPSIQLAKNISMLTKNVAAGGNTSTSPSLPQNIQQVQIMTSSGHIIARTIPSTAKAPITNLQVRSVPSSASVVANDESKTSVLKTTVANSIRTTMAANQIMSASKSTVAKNLKNIRINVSQASEMIKAPMSLLTASQAKASDKETESKIKVQGIQVMQKAGTAGGTQILNVSQLLHRPKNNAVLTGVKLVNTQQGVKMVATSATTVVQTVIPSAKGTSTVAKSLQSDNTQSSPQLISMEALVQGARGSTPNKGQASLIQLATTPGQPAQFAVVSQGSLQPRLIQAQIPGMVQTVASQSGGAQAKATLSNVRMTTTNVTLKPVILTKSASQTQNVILTTDASGGSQALVLTPHTGVRPASSGAMTVMQPGGSQQINLPFGYKGLKVLPIGGPKVYARFVKNPPSTPTQVEVPKTEEQ